MALVCSLLCILLSSILSRDSYKYAGITSLKTLYIYVCMQALDIVAEKKTGSKLEETSVHSYCMHDVMRELYAHKLNPLFDNCSKYVSRDRSGPGIRRDC